MTARETFLKEKDLAAWWSQVAHDPRFDLVGVFARAQLMAKEPIKEVTSGGEQMLNILSTMADAEDSGAEFPSSGYRHEIAQRLKPKPD
jgi:hypothetical protein